MASLRISQSSLTARTQLCRKCLQSRLIVPRTPKRGIGHKYAAKQRLSEQAWTQRAERIKNGEEPHCWDILKERGYVKDIAGVDEKIGSVMRDHRIGAYVGVDPTASSLHVGHLLPFMALFWMYLHGHRAVTLVGGSTAKIGDPTDRLKEREKLAKTDLTMNITKIHYQLKRIWVNVEERGRHYGYQKEWAWSRAIENNSSWLNSIPFIQVVQRLFKGIRMGPLLSRDNVKKRLEHDGAGMPLDEFIYPMIQAWDWWHMFSSPKPVQMQIGGSDQYGNIVSGIEAVKYLRDTETDPTKQRPKELPENSPVGFTVPLLTDSSGAKFGKSAGNAVWLDPFMTSSYDLYGYFMRRPDADVENLLRLLTFMPIEQIKKTMQEHEQDPPKRIAQHALAFEVVCLAHSLKQARETEAQHRALHSGHTGNKEQVAVDTFPSDVQPNNDIAANFAVDIELPESLILGKSMGTILHAAGLASSASDGKRLTQLAGAYIGGAPGQSSAVNQGMRWDNLTFTPVKNWFPADTKNFLIDGKLLILRRGKHFIRIVKMVSDEEYNASGKTYPAMPGSGKVRKVIETMKKMREDGLVMANREWDEMKEDLTAEVDRENAHSQGQLYIPSRPSPRLGNKRRTAEKTPPPRT